MKTVTMEDLLCWAFVHELPKGGGVDGLANANSAWRMIEASSWGKVTAFAELMTMVDSGPGDASNFLIEQGEPHEDAVTVGRAVAALGALDVVLPEGWNPLGDWPATDAVFVGVAAEAIARTADRYVRLGQARHGRGIVNLVVGTAVLGREPRWDAEPPKVQMVDRAGQPAWFMKRIVRDEFGLSHEVEVDGRDPVKRRPKPGAYRKYRFSDDPAGDILSRLDHQIWVAALASLEEALCDQLVGHRLVRVTRSATPWLDRDMAGIALVDMKKDSPSR